MSQEKTPEQVPQQQEEEVKKPATPKMSFIEAIKVRSSIRNFARVPTAEEIAYIEECIKALPKKGPFPDSEARFVYIPAELGFMSSYGVVGGPHHFICGAVKTGGHDLETYGYLFERLQLECYRIGLGTVWLGGTFTVSPFAPYINIKDPQAEFMPAVCPVGLSSGSVGFIAGLIKWSSGATSRKNWSEMFFDGKYGNAITEEAAGQYAQCLEVVRK